MREGREKEMHYDEETEDHDVLDADESDDGGLFDEDEEPDDDDGDEDYSEDDVGDGPQVRVRRGAPDPNAIFARVMGNPKMMSDLMAGRIPNELLALVQASLSSDQMAEIIAAADPRVVAEAQRRSGHWRRQAETGNVRDQREQVREPVREPVRELPSPEPPKPEEDVSNQQVLNELGAMLDEYLDQFENVALGITFSEGRVRIATYMPNPDPNGDDQPLIAKKGKSSRFGDALQLVMAETEDLLDSDEDELVDDD